MNNYVEMLCRGMLLSVGLSVKDKMNCFISSKNVEQLPVNVIQLFVRCVEMQNPLWNIVVLVVKIHP